MVGLSILSCAASSLYILTATDAAHTCLTFFNGLLQLETEFDAAGKTLKDLNKII